MAELLKTSKGVPENLEKSSSPVHTTATNTECRCPYCLILNPSINSHSSCPYFENLKASLNLHLSPLIRGTATTLPSYCDFRLMSDGRSQATTNLRCQCQAAGIDCSRTGINCFPGFNNSAFTGNYGCATNFVPSQLNQVPSSPMFYPVYVPVYIPVPDIKSNFVQKEDKACQVALIYHNCDSCEENPETLSMVSYISDRIENTTNADLHDSSKKANGDIDPKTKINTLYYSTRNNQKDDIYNYEIVRDEPINHPDISELYLQIPQSPPDHDNNNEMIKNINGQTDDKKEIRSNISRSGDDLRFYSATSIRSVNTNFNPQLLMNQLIIPSKTRSRESMMDHFNTDRLENDSMTQNDTESLDSRMMEPNDDQDFDHTPLDHGENIQSFPRLSLPSRDNSGEPDKHAALMMLSLLTSGSDSSGLRKVLDGLMAEVSPTDQTETIPQTSPIDSKFDKPNPNQANDETIPNYRFQQRPRLRKRNGHSLSFKIPSSENSNNSLNYN